MQLILCRPTSLNTVTLEEQDKDAEELSPFLGCHLGQLAGLCPTLRSIEVILHHQSDGLATRMLEGCIPWRVLSGLLKLGHRSAFGTGERRETSFSVVPSDRRNGSQRGCEGGDTNQWVQPLSFELKSVKDSIKGCDCPP